MAASGFEHPGASREPAEQTHLEELQARAPELVEAIRYFVPRDTRKNLAGKRGIEKTALRLSNEAIALLEQIAKPQ